MVCMRYSSSSSIITFDVTVEVKIEENHFVLDIANIEIGPGD